MVLFSTTLYKHHEGVTTSCEGMDTLFHSLLSDFFKICGQSQH